MFIILIKLEHCDAPQPSNTTLHCKILYTHLITISADVPSNIHISLFHCDLSSDISSTCCMPYIIPYAIVFYPSK